MNMRDISGPGKRLSFSHEKDMVTDTVLHMAMASSDGAVERVSKRDVKMTASQHVSCCINKSSPHATSRNTMASEYRQITLPKHT